MPELTTSTEATRIAQATKVLQLVTYEGMTVKDACDSVGISERQYRYWLMRGENTIEEFKQVISGIEREELSELAAANKAITDRIIKLSQTDSRLQDVIAAAKHLREVQHTLESRHGAHGIGDVGAKEFLLSGPKTSKQPSRTGATINIAPRKDGSIDVTLPLDDNDIIEGELNESKDS